MTAASWTQVRDGAAARFERAVRQHLDIPADAKLTVEGGSVTYGITATLHWRDHTGQLLDLPIPGGQHLARSANTSFNLLADRARVLEDLAYEQGDR